MELDSYWATHTISEAQQEGYSHLRATCPKCGRISDIPWLLILRRPRISGNTFIGNIPLRCEGCGSTEPIIGVRHQGSA